MFGKITEIIDNYVYVENSTHELKNNILNIHVIFEEVNRKVVGEVLSVNKDTIKIFLGIKILVKESQIPNEIIYINIKFSSNLLFDIFKPFLSII